MGVGLLAFLLVCLFACLETINEKMLTHICFVFIFAGKGEKYRTISITCMYSFIQMKDLKTVDAFNIGKIFQECDFLILMICIISLQKLFFAPLFVVECLNLIHNFVCYSSKKRILFF